MTSHCLSSSPHQKEVFCTFSICLGTGVIGGPSLFLPVCWQSLPLQRDSPTTASMERSAPGGTLRWKLVLSYQYLLKLVGQKKWNCVLCISESRHYLCNNKLNSNETLLSANRWFYRPCKLFPAKIVGVLEMEGLLWGVFFSGCRTQPKSRVLGLALGYKQYKLLHSRGILGHLRGRVALGSRTGLWVSIYFCGQEFVSVSRYWMGGHGLVAHVRKTLR